MAVVHELSIAIVPTAHEDYLRLECTGTFTLEAALAAYERAFSLASEAGRPAVLVDVRAVTDESLALAWLLGRVAEP